MKLSLRIRVCAAFHLVGAVAVVGSGPRPASAESFQGGNVDNFRGEKTNDLKFRRGHVSLPDQPDQTGEVRAAKFDEANAPHPSEANPDGPKAHEAGFSNAAGGPDYPPRPGFWVGEMLRQAGTYKITLDNGLFAKPRTITLQYENGKETVLVDGVEPTNMSEEELQKLKLRILAELSPQGSITV